MRPRFAAILVLSLAAASCAAPRQPVLASAVDHALTQLAPLSGRWRDVAEGRVLVFLPDGAMMFGSSVEDGPWPASCCPHMVWRIGADGYEILSTHSEAGAQPTTVVSAVTVDGDRMRIRTRDVNLNLDLERLP